MLYDLLVPNMAHNANIMPEEIPELLSYMEDVLPEREGECGMKSDVPDTVIDVGRYLPRKVSEQDQEQT